MPYVCWVSSVSMQSKENAMREMFADHWLALSGCTAMPLTCVCAVSLRCYGRLFAWRRSCVSTWKVRSGRRWERLMAGSPLCWTSCKHQAGMRHSLSQTWECVCVCVCVCLVFVKCQFTYLRSCSADCVRTHTHTHTQSLEVTV